MWIEHLFLSDEREQENDDETKCVECDGAGSLDISRDCETYDEVVDCVACEGTGWVNLDVDFFIAKRDAFKKGD